MTEPDERGAAGSRTEEHARVLAAYSKAASELGYRRVELECVARHAGVPPERCLEHFPTAEQGLLAAQEAFFERLLGEGRAACALAGSRPEAVGSSLAAIFAVLVEASPTARVFLVEAPATSLAAAGRQYAFLGRLAGLLGEAHAADPAADPPDPVIERLWVGGVASIVCEHLLAEEPGALAALERPLVEALLALWRPGAEAGGRGGVD